jgi:hypothetical protein
MPLIVDLSLHKKAALSREEFFNRVRSVEAIPSNHNRQEEGLTLYIHSLETFMLWHHLQDAIIRGNFDGLNGYYRCFHAAIEISDPLYGWLRNTDEDTILRQIVCWLAALYRFRPEKQSIMAKQLYQVVFSEVEQAARKYFNFAEDFLMTLDEELALDKERNIYRSAALAFYGSIPPPLLSEPTELLSGRNPEPMKWGAHDSFDISIGRFYFTNSDWERVVIKGELDDLRRFGSSEEHWPKIKHQYQTGSEKKTVFSLYGSPAEKGQVYLIRAADTGYYKIGYTGGDPKDRLNNLQTGSPHPLSLVGSFSCVGRKTEKLLHDFFSENRLSREWFQLNDTQAEAILNEEWRTERSIF